MDYRLITGATGLLGQYVVKLLLAAGQRVAVLCRDAHLGVARRRIDAIISRFETETGRAWPRPVIIQGDLRIPGLGLTSESRDWLAERITQVVHSAASLKFQGGERHEEPWLTNLQGLKNLLDLCDIRRIESFCHVSTAYVCGTRTGRIDETENNVGQVFGNDYERSKFQGEQLVRAAGFAQTTIFRPSIVVGDSQTGYTSTFHGFYAPLSLGWQMASRHGFQSGESERLVAQMGLRTHDRKNLVPVDWVAAVMARVILDPALQGRTYHLVNPRPVSAEVLTEVVDTAIRSHVVSPSPSNSGTSLSVTPPPGLSFEAGMDVYRSYMRDDPDFDDSAARAAAPDLPCPTLGRDELLSLARFAIREQFGLRRRPLPTPECDTTAYLARHANHHTSDDLWTLDVTGSGGGVWNLAGRGAALSVEMGEPTQTASRVRLSTAVLAALLAGRWTLEEAIFAGLVLVTAHPRSPVEIVSRFQEWIEQSCPNASQSEERFAQNSTPPRTSLIGGQR